MCRCMGSVNVKVSKREIDESSSNPGQVRYVRFRTNTLGKSLKTIFSHLHLNTMAEYSHWPCLATSLEQE